MEFRVLGPLEVIDGGVQLPLGGQKQRAFLARLILDAGQTVSMERLVDDLWGERVPESAVKMVQIYVSHLRKLLPRDLLVTRPPGYGLDAKPETVDLARFERLRGEGAALSAVGDVVAAADRLRAALALWRGPALAEFSEPFAQAEMRRLEELHLACLEQRVDADLALGRHADLVAELDALIARFPHRERLRGQQILALYRSGRQADALRAYREFRHALDEELGLVPSPALKRLEHQILHHAPELEATAHSPRSRPARIGASAGGPLRARLSDVDDIIGREVERAALLGMLDPDGPLVTFVYGFAGVGKSALLRAFGADAAGRGAVVIALDGERIEPTPDGVVSALSAALGKTVSKPADLDDALQGAGDPLVVTLDAYERLAPVDEWLRTQLVPALPAHARLAVAGREPPAAGWSARYGPLAAQLGIDSLAPADAIALLKRLGVDQPRAARFNDVLRGHPLGIHLAASNRTALARGDDDALRPAIDELTRVVLGDLERETREALQAASVVRRVTLSLLERMMPGAQAADVFERLRRLPFVMLTREGLVLFHVFRAVVAAYLRFTDPIHYRALRAAARQQLRVALEQPTADDAWARAADVLYLADDERIQGALFPNTAPWYAVEQARPEDREAIMAIAGRHESPAAAEQLAAWWEQAARAFLVARAPHGGIAGVLTLCEPSEIPSALLDRDPLAAAWCSHLEVTPVLTRERVLFVRHLLTQEAGEALCPAQSALSQQLLRHYLALRGDLRRVYACARQPAAVAPWLEPLGFVLLEQPSAAIGGVPYRTYVHDLGSDSVDGWLSEFTADRRV
jgi:DNA-binding SARP family transcriptional activator